MTKPAPVFGLRRRQRANGEPFMVAVIDRDVQLVAGTELHLRRLHDGSLPTAEFALVCIAPATAPTASALERARADRLDGSALRREQPTNDETERP